MNVVNSSSLLFYFTRRLLNRYSLMCVGNACNLCNGNMSEYPMTHLPTLSRTRLFPPSPSYIYFTFHVVMNFPFFYYLFVCLFIHFFFFAITSRRDRGLVGASRKLLENKKQKLTGYCVCVCRSARDCGATERRCRSFGRNRRVLLPGPRRTDASTLMAQKWTQGESSQKK